MVAIVKAQEFQWVFKAMPTQYGAQYSFDKAERRVGVYVYVRDLEFGVGFIKICTYFPYPAKVWVNGHEWAIRQLDHVGIVYEALSNGFAACDDPDGLQAVCDGFGPADVQGFFDRWISHIPTPFTPVDGQPGIGGNCPHGSSKCPARSCSTLRAEPAGSSSRWSPTTSESAARERGGRVRPASHQTHDRSVRHEGVHPGH